LKKTAVNKDWLDIEVLEDYLDGKLDAREMHLVEKYAMEDPFVAEALEGLSASPKRSLQSISLLQKQLQQRVAEQQSMRKKSVITWQRLSIAATAAVMFVAGSIVFWMKENTRKEELAKQPKKVDVTLAPKESDVAVTKPNTLSEGSAMASPEQVKPATEQEIDKAIAAAKTNAYAAVKPQKKAAAILRSTMTGPVAPAPQIAQDMAAEKLKETQSSAYAAQAKMAAPMAALASVAQTDSVQRVFSGKIVSAENGKPLPGVVVRLKGTNQVAVTGANGSFRITADSTLKQRELVATYLGYKTQQLLAKADQNIDLVLKPDDSVLNEVVVTSRKIKAEKALQGKVAGVRIESNEGMPIGGWDQFRDYVRKNNRLRDQSGNAVFVDFMVSEKGRPYDTKVVRSGLSDEYNQEAIRLVQEGPDWQRPEKKKTRLSTKIDF
jgi:hypothetical protein